MIEVEKVSTVVEGKADTRYLVKLPEYQQKIIILEKYIPELIEKLATLNNK
jgi:hypothetical protein